ncbi:major facilitator superfamily domain-containing protein [Stachybotrys elegans]|uniref:Major facilitator superfamily domain-containing protein n=1 Tax=Stachybotrys elegans TaxID=80388 RepID=A0A8K0T1H0_9HYPO|nr:major facilitator superfamily domain-containing protein [Stachybotrys elegans]
MANLKEPQPEASLGAEDGDQDAAALEKQDQTQANELPPRYSILTTWEKRGLVAAATFIALFSPLSAQIYLPAITSIAQELDISNSQVNLTITTYMILQGIVPMFVGSLADSGGRRPAYMLCFTIYIAANIGLALAPSYGAILGLRALQSSGSSSTVALCTAVVADAVTSAERGQYIGITALTSVLAPSLGPVIGGALAQSLGWRSIFWFLAIFAGAAFSLFVMFFPETCRTLVGDGSIQPPLTHRTIWQLLQRRQRKKAAAAAAQGLGRCVSNVSVRQKFHFKPPNLLGSISLLLEKETGLLLGISSVSYAGFYCLTTSIPSQFSHRYGYTEIQVGLTYMPLAAGSVAAAFLVGPLLGWNYKRYCDKLGVPYDRTRQLDLFDFPIERARMEVGMPAMALTGACLIAWGWAIQAHAHIAVHCVICTVLSIAFVAYNNSTNVLLIDIHPGKAGAASAANNLVRCLLGAGATAVIAPMTDRISLGWAFTLVGSLYFLCVAPIILLTAKGMKWRQEMALKRKQKQGQT